MKREAALLSRITRSLSSGRPKAGPGGSIRATALRAQLRLEERNHRGVEFAMEGRTVKPHRIKAALWCDLRKCWRAWRQERKVASIRDYVVFGLRRQTLIHVVGMARMRQDFIAVAPPNLDRRGDSGESVRREDDAEGRRDHGRGNTRVLNEGDRRSRRSHSGLAGPAAPP